MQSRSTPRPRHRAVARLRIAVIVALSIGALACSGLLEPTSDTLVGAWRAEPMAQQPTGTFLRTLQLGADGRYVANGEFRGVYPQLPANATASITRIYGRYVYADARLQFTQDSTWSWDYLSGESFHVGPAGIAIEGPPTDPTVELTGDRLTLHYMVNPGAGYVPVTDVYFRVR